MKLRYQLIAKLDGRVLLGFGDVETRERNDILVEDVFCDVGRRYLNALLTRETLADIAHAISAGLQDRGWFSNGHSIEFEYMRETRPLGPPTVQLWR